MVWRFEPEEALDDAFRRVAREEIARARASLASDGERDRAVHEARQAFKRLRALARMAQPSLGDDFQAENHRWRDAGRLLSETRDRRVVLEAFEAAVAGCGDAPGEAAIASLRARLLGGDGVDASADVKLHHREAVALLDTGAERIEALAWPADAAALGRSMKKSQKRLRKAWKAAQDSRLPADLHAWRKRVKDQSSQLRLLRAVIPPGLLKLRAEEKQAAEELGVDHDLWILAERLRALRPVQEDEDARQCLLAWIDARRAALQQDALKRGDGIARRRPKAFARAIVKAWAHRDRASAGKARRKRGAATFPKQ